MPEGFKRGNRGAKGVQQSAGIWTYIRVTVSLFQMFQLFSQNTARQEELMKALGVNKVYIDRMSGKDMERPSLRDFRDYMPQNLQ